MKGKFFLYLNFKVVAQGAPGHEWEGRAHDSFESASERARQLVSQRDCEVEIFQLCGTAKKDAVIA